MSYSPVLNARRPAVAAKGLLRAHKWWLLRRLTQIAAIGTFMLGPWAGIWLVQGNFASSRILDTVPLSDPFILVQGLLAGIIPAATALIGGALIVILYVLVGGRVYCSWICPVNIVTDTAYWLREKTGMTRDRKLDRRTRLLVLGGALVAAAVTGTMAWEFVNPVSTLQRGLISGIGFGWTIVVAVFLLDYFVARRAWCSHLCPIGAFYGLVGTKSLIRVAAARREDCQNCGSCLQVCPEPHVIVPALKGDGSRLVLSGDCLNCGACVDSCPHAVFQFSSRLNSLDSGQSST